MIIALLPVIPLDASASNEGYYTYEVKDGTATITSCNDLISGDITIPATLGGYPVTIFDDYAFCYCSRFTSVTIPDSVTTIGNFAFSYCSRLTSVTIPDSVTSIGDSAFSGCSSLTDVYYTGTQEQWDAIVIGDGTSDLTGATLHCIEVIASGTCGENLIWTLDDAGTLTISGTGPMVNYDYGYAPWHSNRKSVKKAVIDNGVTTIGSNAFSDCTSLTNVVIPDGVTTIGKGAFSYCDSLTMVTIPDSVVTIGGLAFYWCTTLTSVTIPDRVTTIGDSAFASCGNLTSVTIPDSVTTIGVNTFQYCYKLISVTIGHSVTTIGKCSFYYCEALTSVTIPNSVTTIDDSAFSNCTSLTDVYYDGTQTQWNAISIGRENECLTGTTIHVKPTVVVVEIGNTTQAFGSVSEAIEKCDAGSVITLKNNAEETISVSKNVTLDLNGFAITGDVTATDGAVVTLKDSSTDDYSAEGGYGKIVGSVEGVEAAKGYMMITENGETSFHRLNLDTINVNVRAEKSGMYFGSQFGGDEVVKRNIVAYGTAMGAGKMPDFRDKTFTRFDAKNWKPGCDEKGNSNNLANGTLLQGIMSKNNGYSSNKRNADMKIYSQAYVELEDGTRILGDVVCYSLRDIFEGTDTIVGVDQIWNDLEDEQKQPVLQLYADFQRILRSWNIPNIKTAAI